MLNKLNIIRAFNYNNCSKLSVINLVSPLKCRPRSFVNQVNQFEAVKMGLPAKEIVKSLQSFAPLSLAESWDNVGVLVDPMDESKPVNTILLTNDLTEDVVDEAIAKKATLIVTYHPNIFQGLKSVTGQTWKQRIIVQCIKNGITVFSPHTSWDSQLGGVNDWLSKAFAVVTIKPIKEIPGTPQGAGRILTMKNPVSVKSVVDLVKSHIGIPHLRLALGRHKDLNSLISTVALCAGSGHSVLEGVDADLYLTGEMLHHDILEATQRGVHVILCNHSDSERGFLREFKNHLECNILGNQVDVVVSQVDKDPLVTV